MRVKYCVNIIVLIWLGILPHLPEVNCFFWNTKKSESDSEKGKSEGKQNEYKRPLTGVEQVQLAQHQLQHSQQQYQRYLDQLHGHPKSPDPAKNLSESRQVSWYSQPTRPPHPAHTEIQQQLDELLGHGDPKHGQKEPQPFQSRYGYYGGTYGHDMSQYPEMMVLSDFETKSPEAQSYIRKMVLDYLIKENTHLADFLVDPRDSEALVDLWLQRFYNQRKASTRALVNLIHDLPAEGVADTGLGIGRGALKWYHRIKRWPLLGRVLGWILI